ncbi:MAG: fasciclin domain-containing protein, partial [Rhodothermales bacterium]
VLTYHVVQGKVTSEQVVNLTSAATLEGSEISISVVDGSVMINDATVTTADVDATNGVVHVIDTVLLPPSN